MVSDRAKLGILALSYTLCLMTLVTSPSISLGTGSLRTLAPAIQQHCHKARKNARECQPPTTVASSSSSQCEQLQKASRQCENVVRKAYRQINLGGCAFPLKVSSSCDDEWCQRGMDPAACRIECQHVRDALDHCTNRVVEAYFQKYGLEKDGTMKLN
jgi:hypothetical protein